MRSEGGGCDDRKVVGGRARLPFEFASGSGWSKRDGRGCARGSIEAAIIERVGGEGVVTKASAVTTTAA